MSPNLDNGTNTWTTTQAAAWAGVNKRRLHDWLAAGLLPAIPVGKAHTQKLRDGVRRHKRAYRWIVPKVAFQRAWENFQPVKPVPVKTSRRRSAA